MITLLYGKNSYALNKYVSEVVNAFIKNGGSTSEVTKLRVESDTKAEDALMQMQNISLFSDKKLTILYDFTSSSEVVDILEQFCESADEHNWLVLVDSTLQARSKVVSYVSSLPDTKIKKADQVSEPSLIEWATQFVKENNPSCKLTPANAGYLIDRVGNDQQLLATELEKLLHGMADTEEITKDYIDSLVEMTPQGSVFAMLDAMLSANSGRAMEIYGEQIAQGVAPQQIVGMIVWQITQLAIVVDAKHLSNKELTEKYGVSSFAVSKLRPVAHLLTKSDIATIVTELMDADYHSRTTASADDSVEYIVSFISSFMADKKTAVR